jgi:RNA polymerase sigma-70 factor (ECF subfamily)
LDRIVSERWLKKLRQAYEENRQALFSYALALTGNQAAAEDSIHTAFARLLARGSCPRELRPYLFRCVRNAAIDEGRAAAMRAERDSLVAPPNGSVDPTAFERREAIEQALDTLAADERECIVLKAFNGLTFREIGEVMDVPLNTAASWYRRGLEKMKTQLEEHGT